MTGIVWPSVLKPQDFGYYHINSDASGGVASDGTEQVVASPGPRWGASMTLPVTNNAKLGGVKTDEGKAKSSLNALKHGLRAKPFNKALREIDNLLKEFEEMRKLAVK